MLPKLKNWFAQVEPSVGAWGENKAAEFLQGEKGFRILERNWRSGKEEIDLIAYDGEVLVFVEVKTRKVGGLVPGYYSVNKRKKKALRRAIWAYMRQFRRRPRTYRLDVVEVNRHSDGNCKILHFSNIPIQP